MLIKRNLRGWKRDIEDQRDFLYCRKKFLTPQKVDLSGQCSPIEDQGSLGSCTAQALAGNVEYIDNKDGNFTNASRLFIYYNERKIEGTIDSDSGAYIRDGIKTLAKHGVCDEKLWGYDISKFTNEPTEECYSKARENRISVYQRLSTVNDCIDCLADGFPVVLGISLYTSFESPKVARTGVVPMPKLLERLIGGHAVMITGYDKSTKLFKVRNSWGSDWGDKGYFYIQFNYVKKFGADLWTIRK